jgi:hypothetical protein
MYTYERYNFRVITLLLVLVALLFLKYREYTGAAVSGVLAALLVFSYQGISIDGPGKRFIRYDRFLKLKIGRWEKLPNPSYVTLVRINLSSRRTLPSPVIMPDHTKGAKAFKVNLVVEDEMRYIPVCRGPLKQMREEALRLGRELGIRVLDYTTHEKHWIL